MGSLPTDDAFDRFKNERDYIAQSGRMQTTVAAMDWAVAEIERLRSDAADLQQTFDLQWEADMRAVKMWREAHRGTNLCCRTGRTWLSGCWSDSPLSLPPKPASPSRGRESGDCIVPEEDIVSIDKGSFQRSQQKAFSSFCWSQ